MAVFPYISNSMVLHHQLINDVIMITEVNGRNVQWKSIRKTYFVDWFHQNLNSQTNQLLRRSKYVLSSSFAALSFICRRRPAKSHFESNVSCLCWFHISLDHQLCGTEFQILHWSFSDKSYILLLKSLGVTSWTDRENRLNVLLHQSWNISQPLHLVGV